MTDRIYIAPLREGSDDCWGDSFSHGLHVIHSGSRYWMPRRPQTTRHCAPWTGTSDREVLDSLTRGE